MKKYLLIAVIVLLGLLSLFVSLYVKQIKETKRVKNNYDIELSQELDRQQILTTKELRKYYEDEISTLKSHGVKASQVENIIKVKYNWKDTTITRDTLCYFYDTIKDYTIAHFDIKSSCNQIKGYVFNDTIEINSIETNDILLISLYREKRKCLFKKRGIRAIAISECKGDTLAILRNLKVEQ